MVINLNHPESWSVPNRAENPDMHVGSTRKNPHSHRHHMMHEVAQLQVKALKSRCLIMTSLAGHTISQQTRKHFSTYSSVHLYDWIELFQNMIGMHIVHEKCCIAMGMRRWDGLAVARPALVTEKKIFCCCVVAVHWHFFSTASRYLQASLHFALRGNHGSFHPTTTLSLRQPSIVSSLGCIFPLGVGLLRVWKWFFACRVWFVSPTRRFYLTKTIQVSRWGNGHASIGRKVETNMWNVLGNRCVMKIG